MPLNVTVRSPRQCTIFADDINESAKWCEVSCQTALMTFNAACDLLFWQNLMTVDSKVYSHDSMKMHGGLLYTVWAILLKMNPTV